MTKNRLSFIGTTSDENPFFKPSEDREKQHLAAGYVSLTYKCNKNWSLDAGLRLEETDFEYSQNGTNIAEQSKTYTDWLPSASVNYQKDVIGLRLSYSSKVYRPSYSTLNNNYTYVSHTSWESGNPLLQSSINHSVDLDFSYKRTYLTVSYIRKKRDIRSVYSYMEEQNVNIRQDINLPDYNAIQIVASQRLDVGPWHPMLQGLLQIQDLEYGTPQKKYNRPIGRLIMDNRFDLPLGIYAYLTGIWISKGNDGPLYSMGAAMVDLTLSKSIKSWTLNLMANDFLKSWRQKNLEDTNGVSYMDNRKGASCFVQLSISYTFNNRKNFKGKGAARDEIDRL